MTAPAGSCGRRIALAIAAFATACQPLPHPFADDRPPSELTRTPGVAGVSIAPIEGEPSATAAKLGAAVAEALLKREIPASDKTTSLGSYLLYGRVVEARPQQGDATVTALWRLYDSRGRTVSEHNVQLKAKAREWGAGEEAVVRRLAAASAESIAPMLEDKAPAETAVSGGQIRIAVGKVSGAPGDGGTALAAAVAAILKRQDVAVVEDGHKADLYLAGEVAVSPAKPNKQHVKIVWRMRRADGAEIGTVGQENDVPAGLLDGAWGDVAYSVAIAAGDGLMQLVARGTPPPGSATPKS